MILAALHIAILALAQPAATVRRAAAELAPGSSFSIGFPEMPPTLYALDTREVRKAQMTVYLPRNYDRSRRFPLLIFLSGGNGGGGGNPGVARGICEDRDFVCVSIPLFKAVDPKGPGGEIIMRDADARVMWPLFRTMLARLEEAVPNIDPAHRVLGGFSNGAHATQGLIDQSNGERARRFSAFFFVEGGGRLQHYELLKGKPFLMVYGSEKSRKRAAEIADAARAAGARTTLLAMNNVGHAFPATEYPAVRTWLREAALK
ncbi:MAG TPA: hypothetical protein VKT77_02345 [Chthonomonadaceae bacterium]|nr:hypothetical protein [Chthonomonadaceae bacterium]